MNATLCTNPGSGTDKPDALTSGIGNATTAMSPTSARRERSGSSRIFRGLYAKRYADTIRPCARIRHESIPLKGVRPLARSGTAERYRPRIGESATVVRSGAGLVLASFR